MIVTLTPNPSIDRTITVTELRRGEVHRATSSRIDPGGKGINVSRALSAQGCETLAVLPVGGPEGHLLIKLLADAGVPHRSVAVAGAARMNIAVVEPDGTTTKLNEAGPTLSAAEIAALLDAVADAARRAQWVVGCGSLPPGAVLAAVGWQGGADVERTPEGVLKAALLGVLSGGVIKAEATESVTAEATAPAVEPVAASVDIETPEPVEALSPAPAVRPVRVAAARANRPQVTEPADQSRTDDELRAAAEAAIRDGRLPAHPSGNALRTVLGIGAVRARSLASDLAG